MALLETDNGTSQVCPKAHALLSANHRPPTIASVSVHPRNPNSQQRAIPQSGGEVKAATVEWNNLPRVHESGSDSLQSADILERSSMLEVPARAKTLSSFSAAFESSVTGGPQIRAVTEL
jgi:hypothetical protein